MWRSEFIHPSSSNKVKFWFYYFEFFSRQRVNNDGVCSVVELTFPAGVEEEIMREITPANCVFSLTLNYKLHELKYKQTIKL